MKTLYAVEREGNGLARIGRCRVLDNHVVLDFEEGALGHFADRFRPFVLLGHRLEAWPAEHVAWWADPDHPDRRSQTKIWAAPAGKRPDHRPVVWTGGPVGEGLAVLVPACEPAKLVGYETSQDGFLRRL